MKAAFTVWNERISPVFDVARSVLIVKAGQGEILAQEELSLAQLSEREKLHCLLNHQVELLVCGAISRSLQSAVESVGIRVYPFCSGDITQLISCWLKGDLERECFAMPGCRHRRHQQNGCGKGSCYAGSKRRIHDSKTGDNNAKS